MNMENSNMEYDNNDLVAHCRSGDLESVRHDLLIKDLNIHYLNEMPLQEAIIAGQLHIVQYLVASPELTYHAFVVSNHGQALRNAVSHGHVEIFDFLLQHYSPTPEQTTNYLQTASAQNKVEILQYYYDKSPELFKEINLKIVLETAINYGHTNILQWADSNNIDYTSQYHSLLYFALEYGKKDVIYHLIVDKKMQYDDKIQDMLTHYNTFTTDRADIAYAKDLFEKLNLYNNIEQDLPINNKKKLPTKKI